MSIVRKTVGICALALSTATLAYGQSSVQHTVGPTVHLEGGGVQHVKSGLQCPATLASLQYKSNRVVSESAEDILCEYEDKGRKQQLSYFIFTPIEGLSSRDVAMRFAQDMVSEDQDLQLNQQASRECQIGVGGAMLKLSTVQGDALAPPCIVLTRPERTKLVSVWERDAWSIIALMSGPDTRVTNAATAVFALSHQDSGQSVVQPKPSTPAPAQRQGVGKEDVDEFCSQPRTQPTLGMQFNGKPVAPEVAAMKPGRYNYPDNAKLLYFPDGSYLVRLPDTRKGIFGTDGDDMAMAGGIVAGCFVEQLSEIFELNELDVDRFKVEQFYE